MILRPAGLLVRQEKLLLMVYRYGQQARFNLPGGKLDEGEVLTDCLIREWQEELGLRVEVGSLALVVETLVQDRQVLHLLFHIQGDGEPCLNPRETSAESLLWLPLDQLASAPLYPAVGTPLQQVLRQPSPINPYLGRVRQPWLG